MVKKYGVYPVRTTGTTENNNLETWTVEVWHDSPVSPTPPALPAGSDPACRCTKQTQAAEVGGGVWVTTYNYTNDKDVTKINTLHAELLNWTVSATFDDGISYNVNASYYVEDDKRLLFLANQPTDPSGLQLPLSSLSPIKDGQHWIYSANFQTGADEGLEPETGDQSAKDIGENQHLSEGSITHQLTNDEIVDLLGLSGYSSDIIDIWRDWYNRGLIINKDGNAVKHIRGLEPEPLGVPFATLVKIVTAPESVTITFAGIERSLLSKVTVKQPNPTPEEPKPKPVKPSKPPGNNPPTENADGFLISFDTSVFTEAKMIELVQAKYIWGWRFVGMEFEILPKKTRKADDTGEIHTWQHYNRSVHWQTTLIKKP